MKLSVLSFVAVSVAASAAMATPPVTGAKLNTRVFNDNPGSTLVTNNTYPVQVQFSDSNVGVSGANRHNWRVSGDAGATSMNISNAWDFSIFSDVTLSGAGQGEGGLNLSPWWSQNVDGVFMLNTGSGEGAIFGGRLPFYSFTTAQAVNYVKGTTVRLGIEYNPNGLSMASPGQIRYWYNNLNSGWINFDAGNPNEPYGLSGILNQAQVGGYVQIPGNSAFPNSLTATFGNITFVPAPGAAGLLAVGGLVAVRRRRR